MKIVIAGGSGMIGTALTRRFLDDGHELVVLTRDPRRVLPRPGLRGVAWRPPEPGAWSAELAGAGAVVNLAGASIGRWPWTPGRKRLLRESRLDATGALVGAIATLPPAERPATLLNASGTDMYAGRDEVPADETTPPGDSFLARLCVDWEAAALRAEASGVRVVLLRQGTVHARGAPALRVLALPFRLFVGGRVGSGRQWMSWVDIADVVGLYRLALASEAISGPLNVAAPDPRPQAEYARAMGRVLHRPSRVPTPAWAVRLVLGGQADLTLDSRRVWPAKALDAGYAFERPRLEDSLADALR